MGKFFQVLMISGILSVLGYLINFCISPFHPSSSSSPFPSLVISAFTVFTATSPFHRSACNITSGCLPSHLHPSWGGMSFLPHFWLAQSDVSEYKQGKKWGKTGRRKTERKVKRPKEIICEFTAVALLLQNKAGCIWCSSDFKRAVLFWEGQRDLPRGRWKLPLVDLHLHTTRQSLSI